jgi:hypothetical protein
VAQKAKKKPAKMANRNIGTVEAVKDDGDKYAVIGLTGKPCTPATASASTRRCAWRRRWSAAAASPASSPTARYAGRVELSTGTFEPAA